MVYEARKQSMAWMETDYSKDMYFRWKIKWRLELLGALGIMGEYRELSSWFLTLIFFSTFTEAVDVSSRMGAKFTILTHLSHNRARYHPRRIASLPLPPGISTAFDFMTVRERLCRSLFPVAGGFKFENSQKRAEL